MIRFWDLAEDEDWPSRSGRMEWRPITLAVKDGHIIYARTLEMPELVYSTGEYLSLPGGEFNPVIREVVA